MNSFASKYINANQIFLASLFLFAIALPTSLFLISIAQFGLAIAWLMRGDFNQSFKKFTTNKNALLISSIFLIHLLALLWTSNFDYAFHDLKLKLPLLIIPFTCSAFAGEIKNKLDWILLVFILSCFVSTLVSESIILGLTSIHITDVRQSFRMVSHIRLSLMMVMSIGFIFYIWNEKKFNETLRVVLLIVSIWLILFLFIAELGTGIFITLILLLLYGFKELIQLKNRRFAIVILTSFISLLLVSGYFINQHYHEFKRKNNVSFLKLDKYTANHRNYFNDTLRRETENGNYVWLYQSWEECRREWVKRSKLHPDSNDLKGQVLKHTMFRYLASKGLRKDSIGLNTLSDDDIRYIENGITNVKYIHGGFSKRLNDFFYEYNNFKNNGSANGHSVYMRLEFWKTAFHIIQHHLIIGTGTGDINDAFINQYAEDNARLDREYWLRSHNQFLSFTVAFGILGITAIFYIFYQLIILNKKFYFCVFITVILLSFLNEDTLETSTGAVLFAYLASILSIVFAPKKTG
jgi:hypothetical protein